LPDDVYAGGGQTERKRSVRGLCRVAVK